MAKDTILLVPDPNEIQYIKSRVDLMSYTASDLAFALYFGGYIILEGSSTRRYLYVRNTYSTIDFIPLLKYYLLEARRCGFSEYANEYQTFDLQIKVCKDKFSICDVDQKDHPTVEVRIDEFIKTVHDYGHSVYQTLLCIFPELKSHKAIDEISKRLTGR